jgi:hypothetical protein
MLCFGCICAWPAYAADLNAEGERVSSFRVSLRVGGNLAQLERAAEAMDGLPCQLLRKGVTYGTRLRPQPENVLILELDEWERKWPNDPADEAPLIADERRRFLRIAETIARLAPTLASLDRTQCRADLSISTIRQEDWGGFDLPAEFVAAAGAAGLAMGVSIPVLLDEEFEGTGPRLPKTKNGNHGSGEVH